MDSGEEVASHAASEFLIASAGAAHFEFWIASAGAAHFEFWIASAGAAHFVALCSEIDSLPGWSRTCRSHGDCPVSCRTPPYSLCKISDDVYQYENDVCMHLCLCVCVYMIPGLCGYMYRDDVYVQCFASCIHGRRLSSNCPGVCICTYTFEYMHTQHIYCTYEHGCHLSQRSTGPYSMHHPCPSTRTRRAAWDRCHPRQHIGI
jgi:hypothetical protein